MAAAVGRGTVSAARQDPRGTVLAAWLEVEQAINQLVQAKNLAPEFGRVERRPYTAMRLIQQAQLVDPKYVTLFEDLRTLRNQAAHAAEFAAPPDAVIRYAELAKELADELRRKAQAG